MRLIDADKFLSQIEDQYMEHDITREKYVDLSGRIMQQPIIEERKRGKWIPVTKLYRVKEGSFPKTHIEWVDATESVDAVKCSVCREVFDFESARNWCSSCGADMRGDRDETD